MDAGAEDDATLVERARTDAEAFGRLYDRYLARIYAFAYRRTGAHAAAEELTASTFHRALAALPGYEARGLPFGAWLYRIAANLAADHHRAGPPTVPLDGPGAESAPYQLRACFDDEPEVVAVAREERHEAQARLESAMRAVATLPLLQRRAVTLYFGHGLSHAETGRAIGRSEAATKQLVYRAVKTLRAAVVVAPAREQE